MLVRREHNEWNEQLMALLGTRGRQVSHKSLLLT